MIDSRALAIEYLKQQQLLGGDSVILADTASTDQGAAAPAPGLVLPPPGISFDPPSADLFATDPIQRAGSLTELAQLIAACRKCGLCDTRTRTVPGEGLATARLMAVGEGPGRTEDETGRPFVGRAGELLTKILAAIDLPREQVFICNIVKCRLRNPSAKREVWADLQAVMTELDKLGIARPRAAR